MGAANVLKRFTLLDIKEANSYNNSTEIEMSLSGCADTLKI